jgi:hypothetical protein
MSGSGRFWGGLTFAGRGGGQKNQGKSVDRGTHLVLDGRLRCVCLGMHRRCHVPDSGAAIEDSATKLDLFSASADRSAGGRKFSSAMVGFHPVHVRYHHKVSDWPTRRLDAGNLVYRSVVCLRRYLNCPSSARRGGKWVATLSIVAFSLLLSTIWGIRFISDRPSF